MRGRLLRPEKLTLSQFIEPIIKGKAVRFEHEEKFAFKSDNIDNSHFFSLHGF